jgi:RHS repeat-associated protein
MSSWYRAFVFVAVLGLLVPLRGEAQGTCSGLIYSCESTPQGMLQVACSCDGSVLCSSLTNCSDNPFCNPVNPVNVNGAWASNCCRAAWTCTPETIQASTCTDGCARTPQPCEDDKCACGPSGERLPSFSDPVNAVTGESILVEPDLEVGGTEPLKFTRHYTSEVNTWAQSGVVRNVPKPFGGAAANTQSLLWSHNHYSFVLPTSQRWTVVRGNGALSHFTPCTGTPCTATAVGGSASKRERLVRTASGFTLQEAGGRKLRFESLHVDAGGTQERYFLSQVVSSKDITVAQLAYALPSGLSCPQGNTGTAAGVPYLSSVSGPTGALDFQYAALTSLGGATECVVRSVTRRGEGTAAVTFAYARDSGNVERPGQVVQATTASGVRSYSYSANSLQASVGSVLVMKHDYGGNSVSSVTAGGEQLAVGLLQASGCQPGSNCCGGTVVKREVKDTNAQRGDGQGAAVFTRTYETLRDASQTVAGRLYQVTDSCNTSGACSPGTERYEWECATSTTPAYEKARKNKRDAWEVFTYASATASTGQPPSVLEKTAVKKGAQDMNGTGALEEETFSYTYGPNGEQLLATAEKPSVLGAAGQKARTFNRYDAAGRLAATLQSGWTRVFDTATGTWSNQQRWIGTFYFTTRSGESTPDALGRTLETHGPCQVASEAATDCVASTSFPLTRYYYWADTETSARRNRLKKVAVYPAGPSSTPLETLYNAYDAAGHALERVDANGVTTLTTWRDSQQLTETVRVAGVPDVVTSFGYDEAGHLAWTQLPEGNYEVFCYRLVASMSLGCTGGTLTDKLQWKAKSANQTGTTVSERVTYTYWPDGTVNQERYEDATGIRKQLSYAADAHRRTTQQRIGNGFLGTYQTFRSYDGADNLTGLGVGVCGTGVDGQPFAPCPAMLYDRANRLTRVDENRASPSPGRTCLKHDAHGNVTSIDTGLSTSVDCATATPSANASRYQHDDFGRVVEATLPTTGAGTSAGITRFAYDALGKPTVKQTPAMAAAHARDHLAYSYDALGRLLSASHLSPLLTSGAELLFAMGYDASAALDASCGTLANTRERLLYRDDSFGRTWYSYDAWGRTTKEVRLRTGTTTCSAATPFQTPHTLYGYSLNGNLTQVTYSYGRVVTYVYGTGALQDRVASVNVLTWGASGTTTTPLLSQVAWEPYGGLRGYRMHHVDSGTAGSVEYALGDTGSQLPNSCPTNVPNSFGDGTGRVRALWVSTLASGQAYVPGSGNGAVLKQIYTWSEDQLYQSDSCLLGASSPRSETYGRDGMQRLTSATGALSTLGGPFTTWNYGYDSRGNRVSESDPFNTWTLGYASAGHPDRLTSRFSQPSTTSDPYYQIGYSYEYDADGRVSRKLWRHTPSTGGAFQLLFTAGPSSSGASDTVFKAVDVHGLTFNYFYDAEGRRRLKDGPTGIKDEYFYDMGHLLLVDQGNASLLAAAEHPLDEYVWLDGRPVALIRGKLSASWAHLSDSTADCARDGEAASCGIRHLVTDYLGKPVLMLDGQGRVAGTGEYNPFGHVNRVSVDHETPHPYYGHSGSFGGVMKQPVPPGTSLRQRFLFDSLDLWSDAVCGAVSQNRSDTVSFVNADNNAVLTSVGASSNGRAWSGWATPNASGARAVLNNQGWPACYVVQSCNGTQCVPLYCSCDGSAGQKQNTGAIISAYEYQRYQPGAQPFWTPIRLPGQYHDAETDLFENWNRYYDPDIGRYLQPDPMQVHLPRIIKFKIKSGEPITATEFNPYAYANNNPLHYTDPHGLYPAPFTPGRLCTDSKCGSSPNNCKNLPEDSPKKGDPSELKNAPAPGTCVDSDAVYTDTGVIKIPNNCKCTITCDGNGSKEVECLCFGLLRRPEQWDDNSKLPGGWPKNPFLGGGGP